MEIETKKSIKNLKLADILRWIVENKDNEEAMNEINRLTYTYTTYYKKNRNN